MRTKWSVDGPKLYDLTEQWIRKHLGDYEADHANYGWFVDEVQGTITTKIYGKQAGCVIIDTHGHITYEGWTNG